MGISRRDDPKERRARHADAGGDSRRRLGDLASHPFGQSDGVPAVTGQGDDELLAADPRDDGVASADVAKDVADRDQGLVACRVPGGVVDPLEVVEVDHHDRQVGGAVPTRLGGQDAHRSVEARRLGSSVRGSMSDFNASIPKVCTST